jgi:hypothetical protein
VSSFTIAVGSARVGSLVSRSTQILVEMDFSLKDL